MNFHESVISCLRIFMNSFTLMTSQGSDKLTAMF